MGRGCLCPFDLRQAAASCRSSKEGSPKEALPEKPGILKTPVIIVSESILAKAHPVSFQIQPPSLRSSRRQLRYCHGCPNSCLSPSPAVAQVYAQILPVSSTCWGCQGHCLSWACPIWAHPSINLALFPPSIVSQGDYSNACHPCHSSPYTPGNFLM